MWRSARRLLLSRGGKYRSDEPGADAPHELPTVHARRNLGYVFSCINTFDEERHTVTESEQELRVNELRVVPCPGRPSPHRHLGTRVVAVNDNVLSFQQPPERA